MSMRARRRANGHYRLHCFVVREPFFAVIVLTAGKMASFRRDPWQIFFKRG
jgi:hypothetical protein